MYRAKIIKVKENVFCLINNEEGETVFQSSACRNVTDAENQAYGWAEINDVELVWVN